MKESYSVRTYIRGTLSTTNLGCFHNGKMLPLDKKNLSCDINSRMQPTAALALIIVFHCFSFISASATADRLDPTTKMSTKTWDGNAMTQQDMMLKDTVLVLDNDDNVIGSASKRNSHEFDKKQPRGVLHRAFSAHIFDESTGELLLQKRASTKITFPNVRKN